MAFLRSFSRPVANVSEVTPPEVRERVRAQLKDQKAILRALDAQIDAGRVAPERRRFPR